MTGCLKAQAEEIKRNQEKDRTEKAAKKIAEQIGFGELGDPRKVSKAFRGARKEVAERALELIYFKASGRVESADGIFALLPAGTLSSLARGALIGVAGKTVVNEAPPLSSI